MLVTHDFWRISLELDEWLRWRRRARIEPDLEVVVCGLDDWGERYLVDPWRIGRTADKALRRLAGGHRLGPDVRRAGDLPVADALRIRLAEIGAGDGLELRV